MIPDFFKIAANLKTIPRQGWIEKTGIKNPESVADHVFVTSIMTMVLGDYLKINTEKIIRMVLLHDLAESITGDLTPDQISKREKIELENKTIKNILEKLPEDLEENYLHLWKEYVENKSIESQLLHEIDKLEMAFQATIYAKNFENKSFSSFLESANKAIKNPELKKIFNSLLDKSS